MPDITFTAEAADGTLTITATHPSGATLVGRSPRGTNAEDLADLVSSYFEGAARAVGMLYDEIEAARG